ncbi:MAG: YHS domain-containing protein [Candidatus Aadella gelida]|nr:YHS domain-containing protein [Candidatus Aadella gelida]
MWKKYFILIMFIAFSLSTVGCNAKEERQHEHNGSGGGHRVAGKSVTTKVDNRLCPVSGENIESMGGGIKHEYNGKAYNLCCAGCVEEFKKNPEKYSKIAEESVHAEHEGSDHPQ